MSRFYRVLRSRILWLALAFAGFFIVLLATPLVLFDALRSLPVCVPDHCFSTTNIGTRPMFLGITLLVIGAAGFGIAWRIDRDLRDSD